MLDPARLRIDLLVLFLRAADDFTGTIENDETRTRRALINRADVLWHSFSVCSW
jgi:hypothetical protein